MYDALLFLFEPQQMKAVGKGPEIGCEFRMSGRRYTFRLISVRFIVLPQCQNPTAISDQMIISAVYTSLGDNDKFRANRVVQQATLVPLIHVVSNEMGCDVCDELGGIWVVAGAVLSPLLPVQSKVVFSHHPRICSHRVL